MNKERWQVSLTMLFFVSGLAFGTAADALDLWSIRDSGTTADYPAVAYGTSNFVAVGRGGALVTSTNGSDWVTRNSTHVADMYGVSYGNGFFVGAGVPGGNGTNIIASLDSLNWSGLRRPSNANFWGASYAGGVHFLVGSSSTIATATNIDLSCAGTYTNCNWAIRHSGGNKNLGGAAYGNGLFVVVGDYVVMTSTNAMMWNSNFIPANLYDVTYAKGLFVAVGLDGSIQISTNGLTWANRPSGAVENLYRIAFGNGTFVAVGLRTIITSTDGLSWRKRKVPATIDYITGITYGNGTFVASATAGRLLQSAPVSIPSLTATKDSSGTGILLSLTGEIGRAYQIQVATNLATNNWKEVLSFTNTSPIMEFPAPLDDSLPQRFYRALLIH